MGTQIFNDIGKAFKSHPLAAGAATSAVLLWTAYLLWQDISPIIQWLDAKLTILFGNDWLKNLLQSPYFASVCFIVLIFSIWRVGNKVSKREKIDAAIRKDERGSVQALPLELMGLFWERENLRGSWENIQQCEQSIVVSRQRFEDFRGRFPTWEKPQMFQMGTIYHAEAALADCVRLKDKIGSTIDTPILARPNLNSSAPAIGMLPPHPSMQWYDEAHNQPYFIAGAQNLDAVSTFLGHLRGHWFSRERALNDACDAIKSKYPYASPPV